MHDDNKVIYYDLYFIIIIYYNIPTIPIYINIENCFNNVIVVPAVVSLILLYYSTLLVFYCNDNWDFSGCSILRENHKESMQLVQLY